MILLENPKHGDRIDASLSMYPSTLEIVESLFDREPVRSTIYGYVVRGRFKAQIDGLEVSLPEGSFFAATRRVRLDPSYSAGDLQGAAGSMAVVIERHGYRALTQVGVVESKGRLSYIDGCSDTLLVMPARLGDPCLNHLHFPPTIRQTQHTHPSIRLGIVARGRGMAFGPGWEKPLEPGMVFMLEEQELHSFRTDRGMRRATAEDVERFAHDVGDPDAKCPFVAGDWVEDESARDVNGMDVIAFHPDSDWGPTDAAHPMRNRTYIGNALAGGAAGI